MHDSSGEALDLYVTWTRADGPLDRIVLWLRLYEGVEWLRLYEGVEWKMSLSCEPLNGSYRVTME